MHALILFSPFLADISGQYQNKNKLCDGQNFLGMEEVTMSLFQTKILPKNFILLPDLFVIYNLVILDCLLARCIWDWGPATSFWSFD